MSLHAFVSLPPCRLFIISASSFCLRLGSPALSHAFSLPLPLFPRIFFLLAFPCLPTRLPQHLLRTFPRCLLIFLASSFFLPPQPPPASSLSAFPCHRLAASTSTPVSSPLRFPTPSGKSLFATTRAFPLTGILFVLFLVRGASLRCVLFSCGRQGGLPPLLGIKSIHIGVNAIFCKKCVFSMKKIGKCLQIQKKSLPLHPHLRNNGSYKV